MIEFYAYQWDTKYTVSVPWNEDNVPYMDFVRRWSDDSRGMITPTLADGMLTATCPPELLTAPGTISVYLRDENTRQQAATIIVQPRAKPDDYVYTESERWTAEGAVAEAVEKALATGDFTGPTGRRGNSILKVTTAPTAETSTVEGYEYKYKFSLAKILAESGASEVLIGDVIKYSYYEYGIGYVGASYAFAYTRTSIRGANGTAGTSVTVSSVSESAEDGGSNVVTFSDGKTLTVKNGTQGSPGNDYVLSDADKQEIAGMIDVEAVPDYVIEEAEATVAKVFSHGNYGRTIRFIAISDTHEDSAGTYNPQVTVSNRHAGQAIKYIADRIGMDFVAHLGDASSRGAWTTTQEFGVLCDDVMNINKFVFSGLRNTNAVFIPGNHDMMSLSGNQLLNSGAYILFGNMCSGMKDRLGGYGFFDIEDAKVRVIYLNTSDSPSAAAYLALTQEQKNWLCETMLDVNAKDDADEWKMILLSHAPLDFGGAKVSEDILLPYVNGGAYGAYNFANKNKAKIMCNIHGHVHCFSYGYMEDKIRRFSVPNACFIGSNHYGSRTEYADWADTTTYNKTANSGKDTSFSLVTIDLDSGMCYVDNYGAGIDREFSTDYNAEAVKHTNRILSSQESDGTPYNGGTGYKVGYRLNSTGVEKAADNVVVSGFIPYNGEDIELRIPTDGETDSYNYLHIYGPDHGAFLRDADGNTVDGSYHQIGYWTTMFGATRVIDTTTNTMKLTIPKELVYKDAVYIRVSSRITAPLSADTFDVALNESVDN